MQVESKQIDLLDCLAIISFVISLANYEENVDQSQMDDEVKWAVDNINRHLEKQDARLEEIMEKLNKNGTDKKTV